MNEALETAITTAVTSLGTEATAMFTTVLPLGVAVAIGVGVAYFAIRHIRGMAGV